jgi:hypothetical protein
MTDILTRLADFSKLSHELVPCPICGHHEAFAQTSGKGMWIIQCGNLDCVVRVAGASKDKVQRRWNTRPRESALIALVQEAAAEIEHLRLALRAVRGRCTPEMELVIAQVLNPTEAA